MPALGVGSGWIAVLREYRIERRGCAGSGRRPGDLCTAALDPLGPCITPVSKRRDQNLSSTFVVALRLYANPSMTISVTLSLHRARCSVPLWTTNNWPGATG